MKVLKSVTEADLRDKIVLVRVDHNVVKKGLIHDPYRIEVTFPTLFNIVSRGGKLILMTHNGRPKNKLTGEISVSEGSSIEPIVEYLKKKLQIDFVIPKLKAQEKAGITDFIDDLKPVVEQLREGKIDGIYLPNTRWFAGEEDKGELAEAMAIDLASIADVFINDAFGSWQAHTSTYKIATKLPSYAGFLMEKEINNLREFLNPIVLLSLWLQVLSSTPKLSLYMLCLKKRIIWF